MCFNAIRENKILAKISEFTVSTFDWYPISGIADKSVSVNFLTEHAASDKMYSRVCLESLIAPL